MTLMEHTSHETAAVASAARQTEGERRAEQFRSAFMDALGEPVARYLNDPTVQEVMINRFDEVWIERDGRMTRVPGDLTEPRLEGAMRAAATAAGTSLGVGIGDDRARVRPFVNAQIGNLRIAGLIAPFAHRGHCMSIRIHSYQKRSLADYENAGSFRLLARPYQQALNELVAMSNVADTLAAFMSRGLNILVSGIPSGGKTSAMRMLLDLIPNDQRVLVCEDTHEIDPPSPNHLVLVSNREHNVTLRDIIQFTLRARPDRLVVGELRGGEAADFITAMNAGTKAIASIHADGPMSALIKLEHLAMQSGDGQSSEAVRHSVASLVQVVLHIGRRGQERGLFEAAQFVRGYHDGQYELVDIFTERRTR